MRVRRLSIAAIVAGLLAGSVAGTAAQDDGTAPDLESFRTREIEPGVVRILDDDAGHDLTRKPLQIHHIVVGPSGQVWLSVTVPGEDERTDSPRMWPLGQAKSYGPKDGIGKQHRRLFFDRQDRLWAVGSRAAMLDGQEWASTQAKRSLVAPDGTVWLSGSGFGVESWDGTELTRHLENTFTDTIFVSLDGTVGVNAWNGIYLYDGTEWDSISGTGMRRALSPDGTLAVLADGRGLRLFRDGETTTVLEGSGGLRGVAGAPDGSFWLAGAGGKTGGGVYRVDPAEVFAARAEAQTEETKAAVE